MQTAGQKPTGEPNRCNVRARNAKNVRKALFMVALLQSLPLYVVYFGLPRFALPTRSRCPSTARQLESSVFCKNGCMSFLHTKQTKETKNLVVRPHAPAPPTISFPTVFPIGIFGHA